MFILYSAAIPLYFVETETTSLTVSLTTILKEGNIYAARVILRAAKMVIPDLTWDRRTIIPSASSLHKATGIGNVLLPVEYLVETRSVAFRNLTPPWWKLHPAVCAGQIIHTQR